MSLRTWFTKLFRHRHFWAETMWNGYGTAAERTCILCGKIEHRELNPIGSQGPWVDGESPYSASLREERKS